MPGGLTAGWVAKLGLVVFIVAFAIAVLLAADGRWAMPAPTGHLRPADDRSTAATQAAGAALRVSAPLPARRSLDRLQPKRRVATTRNLAAPVGLQEAAPSPEPSPTPTPTPPATPPPPAPAAPVPVATPVPVARTPVPTPAPDRSSEQPDSASGEFDLTDGSP